MSAVGWKFSMANRLRFVKMLNDADIVKIVVGVSAIFIYLLGVTFMSAKIYSAGVELILYNRRSLRPKR